jgi:hypothetical protein
VNVSKVLLGVLLAVLVGTIGLWAVFSDLHHGEAAVMRFVTVGFIYIVGAAAIGALIPRWWFVAGLSAWGPFLMGLGGLVSKILHPGPVPYWSFIALSMVVIPASALVFGYVGAAFRRSLPTVSK